MNENYYNDTNVTELTSKDFNGDTLVGGNMNNSYGLIKFYAPWCGYCKQLREPFEFLSRGLKNEGFKFGAVNMENPENKGQFGGKLEIKGFPTLFWLNDGNLTSYEGERNVKDLLKNIVDFTNKDSGNNIDTSSLDSI